MPGGFTIFERQVSAELARQNNGATPKKIRKMLEDQWNSMPTTQ